MEELRRLGHDVLTSIVATSFGCTFDPDFVGQAVRLDQLLANIADWEGQLRRMNRPG